MGKYLTRRRFLKAGLAAGSTLGLGGWYVLRQSDPAKAIPGPSPSRKISGSKAPRVILVSIDSLDPRYLYLNTSGERNTGNEEWLMPNIRRFLENGAWFENARCHMPSITDPNHLNAVSGGCTSHSGIYSVSMQFFDWNKDGYANIVSPSLSFARDDNGRPVDTLFSAWKRKWPNSKTFYLSGKEWVAKMFDVLGSGVDMIIGGSRFPSYIDPPQKGYRFYDPPGDPDAATDYETKDQKIFSRVAYEKNPGHFPPDMWTVNATLAVLNRELPDFGVVVLAQSDDLQHGLGAAWDPEEFQPKQDNNNVYLSKINSMVCREAVLDGMRDVDRQFGRLISGIKNMPNYQDAMIVLYSDHGHVTHRCKETIADIFVKSAFDSYDRSKSTNLVDILAKNGIIQGEELNYRGFSPVMGSSVGGVIFQGKSMQHRMDKAKLAKAALLEHRVLNPKTGKEECPWDIMVLEDLKTGMPGVCDAGELYHPHFAFNNQPGTLHWPDVWVVAKNNWQLPAVMGLLTNVGLKIPKFIANRMAPWKPLIGGHGAPDTQQIVMAIQGPGIAKGRVISDATHQANHRISDIAVTLAKMLGLEIQSTTVGKNRSSGITSG